MTCEQCGPWKPAMAVELVQSSSSSSTRTTIPRTFTNVPRELGSGVQGLWGLGVLHTETGFNARLAHSSDDAKSVKPCLPPYPKIQGAVAHPSCRPWVHASFQIGLSHHRSLECQHRRDRSRHRHSPCLERVTNDLPSFHLPQRLHGLLLHKQLQRYVQDQRCADRSRKRPMFIDGYW